MNDPVISEVLESAKVLGLSRDSNAVREALRTAQLAIEEGYSPAVAKDLASNALYRAAESIHAA